MGSFLSAWYQSLQDQQLFQTIREGNLDKLTRLLPRGPGYETPDVNGHTCLHYVVETSHVHLLDWFLTFSPNLEVRDMLGATPLIRLCTSYRRNRCAVAMGRRLLAHGADVHATERMGCSALHVACLFLWVDGVALLLEYGADPDGVAVIYSQTDHTYRSYYPDHFVGDTSCPRKAAIRDLLFAARGGCGLK
jgi:ankyrin repeat protein